MIRAAAGGYRLLGSNCLQEGQPSNEQCRSAPATAAPGRRNCARSNQEARKGAVPTPEPPSHRFPPRPAIHKATLPVGALLAASLRLGRGLGSQLVLRQRHRHEAGEDQEQRHRVDLVGRRRQLMGQEPRNVRLQPAGIQFRAPDRLAFRALISGCPDERACGRPLLKIGTPPRLDEQTVARDVYR